MPDVALAVNGTRYGGWTEVEINRSIEQISGTFRLSLTERWTGQDTPWPISHGDQCTVAIDNQVVITGYVDDLLPTFDSREHAVTVVGRDKTGDLVDCSAVAKSGEWQGRDLLQIAQDLCAPFGVTVTTATDIGAPFTRLAIQEGETVFETLDRAARMRGVLLISDGQGGMVISRAGIGRLSTALVQGDNILSGRATYSMRDRFSSYLCKGQANGFDDSTPEQNAAPKGQAVDANVGRYRPLIIIAEDTGNSSGLKDRAVWEAAVRMGRSARPEIRVQGWRHKDGLWAPNLLVPVRCPYLQLDRDMLICGVTYSLGEMGTTTTLELCRPEAFELLPVPETQDGDMAW